MQGNGESELSCLNEACLHTVFSFLPAEGLASAACVNRQWHGVILDDALWQLACRDLDGDDYRRNSTPQLPDISTGCETRRCRLIISPPTPFLTARPTLHSFKAV